MSEYFISVSFSANSCGTIDADDLDDAIEKGYDEFGYASLCHHCSSKLQVDDAIGICVEKDGEEIYDDHPINDAYNKISDLKQQLQALKLENDELKKWKDKYRDFFDKGIICAYEACDWQGDDIQEYAHRIGLLKEITVTESCGDFCACAEFSGFPTKCYRVAESLKESDNE